MMEIYQTYFLCSYSWPVNRQDVVDFIDWFAIKKIGIDRLQVESRIKWEVPHRINKLNQKKWEEAGKLIADNSIENFALYRKDIKKPYFDFYLNFLGARKIILPEYLGWFGYGPEPGDNENNLKFFTFSVYQPLFLKLFKASGQTELINRLEKFFVRTNCRYGYGALTKFVIGSPFQFICDNEPSTGFRIDDFNYRHHIEKVYPFNLLSQPTFDRITRSCSRELESNKVYVRQISDQNSTTKAGSIWFDEAQKSLMPVIEQKCADLIPSRDIFREILPVNIKAETYAHEYLYAFGGLIDRLQIFNRIPAGKRAGDNCLNAHCTEDGSLKQLTVNLLFADSKKKDAAKAEEISALINQWITVIGENPDHFGQCRVTIGPREFESRNKTRIEFEIDAEHLRQEAINLFVLMIDEVNAKAFLVDFLLFGKAPSTS